MKRRELINFLAGAWPLATRAQSPPNFPRVGYIGGGSRRRCRTCSRRCGRVSERWSASACSSSKSSPRSLPGYHADYKDD